MFRRFRRHDDVIGFALSGGGSRSAAHVGALKALLEAGITPHRVAGTSAGAVNAAWIALHPHRLDRLEAIWLSLRRQDVFPGSRLSVVMNLVRRGFVHRADMWEAFLKRHVGEACFEDCQLPCSVTAVQLSDGARVVFEHGGLVPALMASTAIPGVFPPYRIGDELYVDGGGTRCPACRHTPRTRNHHGICSGLLLVRAHVGEPRIGRRPLLADLRRRGRGCRRATSGDPRAHGSPAAPRAAGVRRSAQLCPHRRSDPRGIPAGACLPARPRSGRR